MTTHQWHYTKPGLLEDQTVGPLDHEAFLAEIRGDVIKPDWLVFSETATHGQWHAMKDLPKLMEIRERAIHDRKAQQKAESEAVAQQRVQEEAERQAQRAEQKQQAAAEADARRQQLDAESQARDEWKRRQPPESPFSISVTTGILGFIAICLMCAGCSGFVSAETVYQELLATGFFILTGLAVIASLLEWLCRCVKWVGSMLIWKDERDAERHHRR